MKKIIIIASLFSLILTSCTQRQREGWAERSKKVFGEKEQKQQVTPLNPDSFKFEKDKQELIGLETSIVKKEIIEEQLELPGEILPDPNNIASINAPISGWIRTLNANLGSMVEKGAVVAMLENPQNLGQHFELRAPLGGIVTERLVNVDEWIESGKEMLEIVNYKTLYGVIRVYPDEQRRVKLGQDVEFTSNDVSARGKISFISPTVDSITRTIEVRAEIANPQNKLKANAYATAIIFTGKKTALVIPQSALLMEEAHSVVFVKVADMFEKRVVEIGSQQKGIAEILSGVQEGEMIVSKGAYQLKNITFTSKGEEEK